MRPAQEDEWGQRVIATLEAASEAQRAGSGPSPEQAAAARSAAVEAGWLPELSQQPRASPPAPSALDAAGLRATYPRLARLFASVDADDAAAGARAGARGEEPRRTPQLSLVLAMRSSLLHVAHRKTNESLFHVWRFYQVAARGHERLRAEEPSVSRAGAGGHVGGAPGTRRTRLREHTGLS